MPNIAEIKEREVLDTPVLLFECELHDGTTERWSTQAVMIEGRKYEPRVMRHNVFEFRSYGEDGIDGAARVSLVLANADSYFSQVESNAGFKGARLTVKFGFVNAQALSSETRVIFSGTGNAPEEITETTFRVSFNNRLSLQRVSLPETRVQKRCPWVFPKNPEQRQAAVSGESRGRFGLFYRCGYSPTLAGGNGNTNGGEPYTSCDCTRSQCAERGMFDQDMEGRPTRRFGGIEFVPPSITVRSYGEKGSHESPVTENAARYNDFVPLVYGTAWYNPPVIFARNDGNLTRMEVLLGAGEIDGVLRVVANDIEVPQGRPGANMTATGWYSVVGKGERNGAFNADYADSRGIALGDPYGSMAVLSVVVPNRISDGKSLPKVQVLLNGLKLDRWDAATGEFLGTGFTSNPAWIILDVLRRSGWHTDDIDLASFTDTAAYCDEPVSVTEPGGEERWIPRLRCNMVLQKRRSAAEIIRGIRSGCNLYLTTGPEGTLQLRPEEGFSIQQRDKAAGSNATETLNGGWPAYEFGDGSNGSSGLLCNRDGSPQIRIWSRGNGDSANRLSVEFQDEFNGYQQDSLSVVDSDDVQRTGQEVAGAFNALGLPNVYQANRAIRLQIDKAIRGNTFVEFSSSVRAFGLRPGDLITISYRKEGWQRKAFRILKLAPGQNFETVTITAQAHEDSWYQVSYSGATAESGPADGRVGKPKPLLGTVAAPDGRTEFAITERHRETADGGGSVSLQVSFVRPRSPEASGVMAPRLSLSPEILDSGGTLKGGSEFYYAVSGLDASGAESATSFVVRAEVAGEGATSCVRLRDLRFSSGTSSFCVYRGTDPIRLRRIAGDLPVASEFVDTGLPALLTAPADPNYDHANFYWRLELMPEYSAALHSDTSVGHPDLRMIPEEYAGKVVRITQGRGSGQDRVIVSNTTDRVVVSPRFDVEPDGSSQFAVAEPSWAPAGTAGPSSIEFDVPNRAGTVVHVLGKSVNALGAECPTELSPLSRWRIKGTAGDQEDDGVPPMPTFGIALTGKGSFEVGGLGLLETRNAGTITSGRLTVHCWDELLSPSRCSLASAVEAGDEWINLSVACGAQAGDILQIGAELAQVRTVEGEGRLLEVSRGSQGSSEGAHEAGETIYRLSRRTYVLPFAKDLFGSRSSGSYAYPVRLANVRIASAEFVVTNRWGDSPAAVQCFTQTADRGLRTLPGGQYSFQVGDWMSIDDDAAPLLIVDDTVVVRDVSAVMAEAPVGGPVQVEFKVDGEVYCGLTIPDGENRSEVIAGFNRVPLQSGARLGIGIVSVPQAPEQSPGRDLTVTVRL